MNVQGAVSKKVATAGFVCGVLCILGVLALMAYNGSAEASQDLAVHQFANRVSMITTFIFAIVSFSGLAMSIYALVMAKRKPAEYGGIGFAIAGGLVNGVFALLFGISAIFLAVGTLFAEGT